MTYLLTVKPLVGKKFTMTFDRLDFVTYFQTGNYRWVKVRKIDG